MRAVVQRVRSAKVEVDGKIVSRIGKGLAVLLAVGKDDTDDDVEYMVRKIKNLRIFEDSTGKMGASLEDTAGEVLVVSQFTLYGDVRKGNRPSFDMSADFEKGRALYLKTLSRLRESGLTVREGEFGKRMLVTFENDGPVTILIDSKKTF